MFNGRRTGLIAYGAAVLGTGVTLVIRLSLVPWFGYHAELMTFFPVIIISAYLGGLGPGVRPSAIISSSKPASHSRSLTQARSTRWGCSCWRVRSSAC